MGCRYDKIDFSSFHFADIILISVKTIIHASIIPNQGAGGVETVLLALVSALGKLKGSEEYWIVCPPEAGDWLRPFVGDNSRIITRSQSGKRTLRFPQPLRRIFSPIKKIFSNPPVEWAFPSVSDGFLETLGADVIHFPCQDFVISALPSVYSPHDLQHRHFPQFFSAQSLVWREEIYRKACDYSKTVVVGSRFVKDDVVRQFAISPEKIQIIPLAPPLVAYRAPTPSRLEEVKRRYGLEKPFVLYPAMTWPHKNHVRLIDAVERSQCDLEVICTGFQNHHWPTIEVHLAKKKLQHRIRFLGLIPGEDLRALYLLSEFVIIPTLFESTSEPIFEAWEAGRAVACSQVAALPEQTQGAALLFDPYDVGAISRALDAMVHEKKRYAAMGERRLRDFSWEKSVCAYRAVYRRSAGFSLNDEDAELLKTDWMQCKAA